MRKHLLLMVAWVICLSSYAQERTISGRVTSSEDGAALPGVNVLLKNSTQGTVTDATGNFTIGVGDGAVLVFSFIGYTTTEIAVGAQLSLNVQMAPDTKQLSEVVVVGYGTQIKQDLTGNIASIAAKDIGGQPVQGFDQAMQGRAAGVFVESGNGKLGQGIKVRVRGSASISASNEPLYVVDGIIVTTDDLSSTDAATNPLANVNTNDIESIEILKDASAAAIYGARAANGVVLVTTKRGKSGKTAFNVGYMRGVSSPTRTAKWLNGPQYYEAFKEAFDNSDAIIKAEDPASNFGDYMYGEPTWTFDDVLDYELGDWDIDANENWADNAYRNDAGISQLDFSASGGNDKTKFYTSLQYSDQKGILINDRYKKISMRANLDHKASEKISFGLNFSLSRSVNNRLSDDNEFTTPMQMLALPPIQPAYYDGSINRNTVYFNGLLKAKNSTFETTTWRTISNLYGVWQITKDLAFRSEGGIDLLNQNEEIWNGREVDSQTGNIKGGGYSGYDVVLNYSTNNYLSFNKEFGKLNVEATAGTSFQKFDHRSTSATAQTFPSNAFRTLVSASVITDGTSSITDYAFLSYFARTNLKFNNKFLLSLSGRVDGSSKFGADHRYGFFPAASAGWIISQEPWMEGGVFSFLKLRASTGLTGNAPTQNFAALGLYSAETYDLDPAIFPTQLANKDLKWETTLQTDIGVDFGFLNDRITGEIDVYVKNTTDLLVNSNVPTISGFLTRFINIGEVENKGIEFVINSQNTVGALKWSTSFNIGHNKNKITNLNDNVIEAAYLNRAVEGQPLGAFYGIEYAGVDPDNGDALFYINDPENPGNQTTNDYNLAKRTIIGNPNPDFYGGLNNTFTYKGFDLSFLFQFVYGNDVYNGAGSFQRGNFNYFDNQLYDDWKKSWREPGDKTSVPESRLFFNNGNQESSRFLQDASYLRLKTLSFGYNFPSSITSRLAMQNLRVYIAAQNLLTITKYDLNDPEVNTDYLAGNIGQGNDFYAAPQIKTVSVGVNIGF